MSSLIVEVCKIEGIINHPNADRLDLATVKGWGCIVGRDQYKPGDIVVFIPPDSVLPDSLIEKYNLEYLKNGGRVGTVKLRGCLSQGLILDPPNGSRIGQDVAALMGIVKWEPPVSSYQMEGQQKRKSTKKRPNIYFDKYTDIENIKNYNSIFKAGDEIVITEKIHGTNFRAGTLPRSDKGLINKIKSWLFGTYEFVYGSHNVQLTSFTRHGHFYTEDVYGKIAKWYNLANIIPNDFTIYGEIYGKGVQDLTYGKDDIDVVFFDAKYKGKYLPYSDFRAFCDKLSLPTTPVLYVGEFHGDNYEYERLTNGMSKLCSAQVREGCVIKDTTESNDCRIGRKILKNINSDYLLRKNGTEFK